MLTIKTKSQIENVKPELKYNDVQKLKASTSSRHNAKPIVMRSWHYSQRGFVRLRPQTKRWFEQKSKNTTRFKTQFFSQNTDFVAWVV